jgi:hypothetical protein
VEPLGQARLVVAMGFNGDFMGFDGFNGFKTHQP